MKNLWLSKKKQLNFSRSMQNYFSWLNTTRGDIQPLGIVMATRKIMMNNRSIVLEFPIDEIQDLFVHLQTRSLKKEIQLIIIANLGFRKMVCSIERCKFKMGLVLRWKKGSITFSLRKNDLKSLKKRLSCSSLIIFSYLLDEFTSQEFLTNNGLVLGRCMISYILSFNNQFSRLKGIN